LRQECKFRVYLCRAADPESKGKIKNVVKYIKGNFLENRIYPEDDETLNYCCLQWLEKTGNAKIHGTTKRVPAEVFQ
jgi:transposase